MGRLHLARLLRLAYSGELAAALAYLGHARSVRDEGERRELRRIAHEELHHRRRLGQMLAELDTAPDPRRERRFRRIGRTLMALCHVSGWFLPMYGAGWLERHNVVEYEVAARHAADAGLDAWAEELLVMAENEWDHEAFFRAKVESHWMRHVFRPWAAPPPRANIRETFVAERAREGAATGSRSARDEAQSLVA